MYAWLPQPPPDFDRKGNMWIPVMRRERHRASNGYVRASHAHATVGHVRSGLDEAAAEKGGHAHARHGSGKAAGRYNS